MKALLLKDFCLLKRQAQFMVVMIVVTFGIVHVSSGDATFAISYLGFMGSMLVLNVLSYDEYNNGLAFLMILPYSRKDYVKEKYLLVMILTSLSGMVGLLIASFKQPVDLLVAFILIVITSIVGIVEIPVQLKFGIEKSRIALVVSMAVVALLAIGLFSILPEAIFTSRLLPLFLVLGFMIISLVSYQISLRIILKKEF